ncbi:4-hydroxybenzoate transporter PcaK [Paraburkholderia unamae]|uniref:MFS transporter n=1 Tax=Paraburkholderia unamae TaxID=219649 RepID=UPI000DC23F9B|nr:MFS transporter [Paraburkholderia unamae]RAR65969.1 AAHS family 4-hydroxybenzoate transporter-like MFS transporter [Paraburkholderia unamae]CAG9266682.1 4-hydroxybenzoate transporter PcaK [Paraburkholderia unamae]
MKTLDVQSFIDERPLNLFHLILFVLCFLTIVLDGLDTSAMGLIAPALIKEWGVTKSDLAPVLSAALIGIGIGAAFAAPVADRIGRRSVLVASVAFFGVFSLAAGYSTNVTELLWARLLTGVGLGAAIPNCATLMSEYVPTRMRSMAVNFMLCGFAFGGAVTGPLAKAVIPAHGWQGYLIVGGIAPIVVAVLLALTLPESVRYLAAKGNNDDRIAKALMKLAPGTDFTGVKFVTDQAVQVKRKGLPVSELFSSQLAMPTILIWIAYFCSLVTLYVFQMWLPSIMQADGHALADMADMMMNFNLVSAVGIFLSGILMDRFGPLRVISGYFAICTLAALVVGITGAHGSSLVTLLMLVAMTNNGACSSMSTLATQMYPTSSRVTGAAWMLTIGRFGGVAGTFLGPVLLSMGWTMTAIVAWVAVPAVLASLSIIFIGIKIPTLLRRYQGAAASFH